MGDVTARMAGLEAFRGKSMGMALEASGGLYRRMVEKFPKSGGRTHTELLASPRGSAAFMIASTNLLPYTHTQTHTASTCLRCYACAALPGCCDLLMHRRCLANVRLWTSATSVWSRAPGAHNSRIAFPASTGYGECV